MKKRYWLIGALLIYALFKQADGGSTTSPPQDATRLSVEQMAPVEPTEVVVEPGRDLSSVKAEAAPNADPPPITLNAPTRYVAGKRVGFRSGPSTNHTIIDRFDVGRKVSLLERAGDWSRIRDDLTQHEGWIASRFLSETVIEPKSAPAKTEPKDKKIEVALPVIPDSALIQRIIAESLASYPGSCACPYSHDRAGRRCGKRSAYSKPGGYAPVCFPADVSKAMIEAFRAR